VVAPFLTVFISPLAGIGCVAAGFALRTEVREFLYQCKVASFAKRCPPGTSVSAVEDFLTERRVAYCCVPESGKPYINDRSPALDAVLGKGETPVFWCDAPTYSARFEFDSGSNKLRNVSLATSPGACF